MVLPHVGDVSGVGQKGASGLLVAEMKEPRTILVGVGLEVEQKIDLMRRRSWPFLELVEDIERDQHPIPIRGNLKRGYPKVVCHPLKE